MIVFWVYPLFPPALFRRRHCLLLHRRDSIREIPAFQLDGEHLDSCLDGLQLLFRVLLALSAQCPLEYGELIAVGLCHAQSRFNLVQTCEWYRPSASSLFYLFQPLSPGLRFLLSLHAN